MKRLAVLLCAMAGCAQEQAGAPSFDAGAKPPEVLCDRVASDVYTAGIEHASSDGSLHVKILDALPAPPSAGDNTWTVRLTDAGGAPLGSATPTVEIVDSARGLSSVRSAVVTPVDAQNGVFRIEKIQLAITGPWDIAVAVGGGKAEFKFCVES
jgi:hypothetical protein